LHHVTKLESCNFSVAAYHISHIVVFRQFSAAANATNSRTLDKTRIVYRKAEKVIPSLWWDCEKYSSLGDPDPLLIAITLANGAYVIYKNCSIRWAFWISNFGRWLVSTGSFHGQHKFDLGYVTTQLDALAKQRLVPNVIQ